MRNTYFLMDHFNELASEFDRFFYGDNGVINSAPQVNIRETDEEIQVQVVLPGMKKEDINVLYEQGWLEIKGSRKLDTPENTAFLKQELHDGEFERRIKLETVVDSDAIEAVYEDGILSLRLIKAEQAKARQISIS